MKNYLLILFLGLLACPSFGESKPKIQLIFHIDQPLYKLFFKNELASLETSIQKKLCPIFNSYLSFIDFSTETSEDKFIISLHNIFKNSKDFTIPKDVVFFFDFNGPRVKNDIPPLQWNFQNKSKYGDEPFSAQDFSSAIISVIEFKLKSNYEMMVESIFSKYILTKEAYMISQLKGWALPFSSDNLGIGTGTEFGIEVEKETDFGPATCEYFTKVHILKIKPEAQVPPKFKGCFIVISTSPDDDCSVFSSDNLATQIKEVTIKIFDRQEQLADETVPPENFVPDIN